MFRYFKLFVKNGGFVTFVVMELICFYLIVNHNSKQNDIYAYTTGLIAGKILNKQQKITRYFDIAEQADSLAVENAALRSQLLAAKLITVPYRDTFFTVSIDSLQEKTVVPSYEFIAAEVISNSVGRQNNWIILNRGSNHKIRANMGVLSPDGIVGVVRHVDKELSLAMSVLHKQSKISVKLKRQGILGSLTYDGSDADMLILKDIPKHVILQEGDSIVTSGYSTMFPADVFVGKVVTYFLPDGENFFEIKVRLNNNMSKINHVYVVDNLFQSKIDSIQQYMKNEQ